MTVRVDTTQLDQKLNQVERGLGKVGLRDILESAGRELERVTRAAFRGKHDPATFQPWEPRKGGQPWPALEHEGELAKALGFSTKALRRIGFIKATIEDKSVPRPTSAIRTYQNLAFLHFYGNEKLAPRRFFFERGKSPPGWFVQKVKNVAVRAARRAVG